LKKPGLILLLTYTFSVCSGQTDKLPVFKSTFSKEGQPRAAQHMEMWDKVVQYIGPYKDTILLSGQTDRRNALLIGDSTVKPGARKRYARYEWTKLKIVFDPSKQVTLAEDNFNQSGGCEYYKAYSILICNETDSTTIVGEGWNIQINLEALDTDSTWKPAEVEFTYFCGNGLKPILLKPREVLCVLTPVYTGEFRTKLRYRLGQSFSQEFYGSISRNQFTHNRSY
jgi:hypothetical protein